MPTPTPSPVVIKSSCLKKSATPPLDIQNGADRVSIDAGMQGWVKTTRDQRRYRDMHRGVIKCDGVPPIDLIEENRVNALRTRKLVGKTINGTFFKAQFNTHGASQWHWIRWNNNQADNVCIPDFLAREVFKGAPQNGIRVRCVCTALGPDDATAWGKRPHCETFEIVSNNTLQVPNPQPVDVRNASWRTTSPTARVPSLRSDSGSPIWTRRMTSQPAPARSSGSFANPMGSVQASVRSASLPRKSPYKKQAHLNVDLGAWRTRSTNSIDSMTSIEEMGGVEWE